MTGLRLEIDLGKIGDNARLLVDRAAARGVSITAVTKALLGEPRLARTLVAAGVGSLGDSRIENIERMRHAHIHAQMVLIRSPMRSQVDRIVRANTISANSEVEVLSALATAARVCGRIHGVMIMIELGDVREGIMAKDLEGTVRHILRFPSLRLHGIGTNLACRNGVAPTDDNMGELSRLAGAIEASSGVHIETVSGGNSANVDWMANAEHLGRVNNLRLGEAMLLGRNPLDRQPIAGLHTDAITLVGEVIESQYKPTQPWGRSSQNAFGDSVGMHGDEDPSERWQTIIAAGRQDVDPDDLESAPGVVVLGASSDHLLLQTDARVSPGSQIRFEPGYSALLRSMTSPFVDKRYRDEPGPRSTVAVSSRSGPDTARPATSASRSPKLTLVPRLAAVGTRRRQSVT